MMYVMGSYLTVVTPFGLSRPEFIVLVTAKETELSR